MGRWGVDIYESDKALDFFSIIRDLLERELVYWFAPEQIASDSGWLSSILSVIELLLLLDQRDEGDNIYIYREKAIKRWRDTFLEVWDADWDEKKVHHFVPAYSAPTYRQKHRAAVVSMFDYLRALAAFWESVGSDVVKDRPDADSVLSDYRPPYFSIHRWKNNKGQAEVSVLGFANLLIEYLRRDIIYKLSPERRRIAISLNVEDVWVAVELLGFISDTYKISSGVNVNHARIWRETTILIGKAFVEDGETKWGRG